MSEDLKRIEAVLDQQVRPALRAHGGEIQIDHLEDGVLYFRMLGQCSNCPSAVVTAEELVAPPILEAIPEIRQVVLDTTVSDELWQDAMELLRRRHNGEA